MSLPSAGNRMRPTSRDLHSLAAPYALDALEPAERRRFERHLKGCDSCAAEVRALSEDAVRLAWSHGRSAADRDARPGAGRRTHHPAGARRTPGAAPRRGRSRYGRASRSCRRTSGAPSRRPGASRRPLFVPFATATAAAALVVASLFAVQANRTQDELDAQKAQAVRSPTFSQAPDARATREQDAQGRTIGVIASASEGRAVVTLSGYGAPPSGRVRQLWLMRPNEQPRSLGLFAGDTPLVATGLDKSATSLAVTVEPDGGSPQPTTQPVVQLALKSVGFGE